MSNYVYIYIEILRQVRPVLNYNEFRFFLLGSFDAMDIYPKKCIADMKKEYEKRHEKLPTLFDRQPIFLYTPQGIADIDAEDSIFCRSGEFASRPLILTLFQMDKKILANKGSINTPNKLLSQFDSLIKQEIEKQGCKAGEIFYQTFWNLGESDIAVVFRPELLKTLARILDSLRILYGKLESENPMRIISASSHCGFPGPEGLEGSLEEKEKKIFDPLKKWIQAEFSNDFTAKFVTLTNTSAGYNVVDQQMRFLFGEWDYMRCYTGENKSELIEFLQTLFSAFMQEKETEAESEPPFRISYTIPAFSRNPLQKKEEKTKTEENNPADRAQNSRGESNQGQEKRKDDPQWIIDLRFSFKSLCEAAENALKDQRGQELIETIRSFKHSITGLAKFLHRLRKGRFEDDLYEYVQPVFFRLGMINNNYKDIICSLNHLSGDQKPLDSIDNLIKGYISDTAKLIESLQHLFSIMAVSPHTFMETYGSSMRSLAASDKLLNAYQGMVRFLKDYFPDKGCGREILILPYRKAQSEHTLLYPQSDPINRISFIRIDFTKMFNMQASSFMLLHECGHHLGNRLREIRFICFSKAAVCLAFEWIGGAHFLDDPVGTFVSRLNNDISREMIELERESLFARLRPDIEEKYQKKIRRAMQKGIRYLSSYYCRSIKKRYKSSGPGFPFLERMYDGYFSGPVLNFLQDIFIPQLFGLMLYEESVNKEQLQYCKLQQEKLTVDVQQILERRFYEIACRLSEDIIAQDGNIREALRLKTIYGDVTAFAHNLLEGGIHILEEYLRNGKLEWLYSVFSDIYSDIFAISILNIDLESYIKTIPMLLGVEINEIMNGPAALFRVYVVSKALWSEKADDDVVFEWLTEKLTEKERIKKALCRQWETFKNTSYLCYLFNYAKRCKRQMEKLIQNAETTSDGKISMERLRHIFKGDASEKINDIYHFCQYLMKKENGENSDINGKT